MKAYSAQQSELIQFWRDDPTGHKSYAPVLGMARELAQRNTGLDAADRPWALVKAPDSRFRIHPLAEDAWTGRIATMDSVVLIDLRRELHVDYHDIRHLADWIIDRHNRDLEERREKSGSPDWQLGMGIEPFRLTDDAEDAWNGTIVNRRGVAVLDLTNEARAQYAQAREIAEQLVELHNAMRKKGDR